MINKQTQAILLLAAGASRRMGRAKQLLHYDERPVIAHLLKLLGAQGRRVYVVLGARRELVQAVVDPFPVATIINMEWEKGMGTSLKAGVRHILAEQADIAQVLCCVVDQVYLSQSVLDQFWVATETHSLIAARYANGTIGVPACFGRDYLAELLKLADTQGAKPLLKRFAKQLHLINFPKGDFDLDYPADWEEFLAKRNGEKPSK